MESYSHPILSRIETCDTTHLSSLHQEIYDLSEEDLGGLVLDLIPALFRRLHLDSHLSSLHVLEYVVTSSNPKEVLLSLMEVACWTTDTYSLPLYLLYLKMLALVLNRLPPSSLSHALPSHSQVLLRLGERLREDCGAENEVLEGEEMEWMLSPHSIFEIDFKCHQLKAISARQGNRLRLNTLLISNSLLLSALRSLQHNSLHYLRRQFPSLLPSQLWLLGLSLSLELTQKDICTQFLFAQIVRSRLRAILALTDFTDLYSLLGAANPLLGQEEEGGDFKRMVGLGLSLYIYLSISHPQRLLLDPVPLCLSRGYLYECMCPVASVLLSHSAPHITSLGLSLLEGMEGTGSSLGEYSEWDTHAEICHLLSEVMLYSQEEECRKRAVLLFKRLILLYPPSLLHWIYRHLLWRTRAPPALGFLISCLKEELHATLSGDRGEGHQHYFTGLPLLALLKTVLRLGSTEPSQVLEQTDSILSSLNLLRYLLLRDPRDRNRTHVWSLLPRIDAYSSRLSLVLEEAMHRTDRELELLQRGESRTEKDSLPSQPSTLMLQQDLNRLALIQDINNRLIEIIADHTSKS